MIPEFIGEYLEQEQAGRNLRGMCITDPPGFEPGSLGSKPKRISTTLWIHLHHTTSETGGSTIQAFSIGPPRHLRTGQNCCGNHYIIEGY